MNKKVISLALIFMLFGGLLIISCDKDTQNSPVEPDLEKKATLSGLVYANLSEKNDTLPTLPSTTIDYEFAPEGTLIQIRVEATNYADFADGYMLYTTTVGSDGSYSIDIPATNEGISVDIFTADFEYQKVVGNWAWNGAEYEWEGSSIRKQYFSDMITVAGIISEGTKIKDIYYDHN